MTNDKIILATAKRIPAGIRKILLEEQMIDKAMNAASINSPMEYLFDVYNEFLDPAHDVGNWHCAKCREKVLSDFRRLKPYFIQLSEL